MKNLLMSIICGLVVFFIVIIIIFCLLDRVDRLQEEWRKNPPTIYFKEIK